MKNIERTRKYFNSHVKRARLMKEIKQSEIPRQTGRVLAFKLKGTVCSMSNWGRK